MGINFSTCCYDKYRRCGNRDVHSLHSWHRCDGPDVLLSYNIRSILSNNSCTFFDSWRSNSWQKQVQVYYWIRNRQRADQDPPATHRSQLWTHCCASHPPVNRHSQLMFTVVSSLYAIPSICIMHILKLWHHIINPILSIYLKNNSVQFHVDPILNNWALGFCKQRCR